MDGSARPLLLALLTLAARGTTFADDSPGNIPTPPRATSIHTVSPQLAAVFAERMPKLPPAPPAATVPMSRILVDKPANGIVRLPEYIVREPKVPPPPPWQQVDRGRLARWAMDHYLGPEDGVDRGFLNLITSKQFPLLGLFGSVSNEQRAIAAYEAERRREQMKDLMDLVTAGKKRGADPANAQLRTEVQRSFMSDPRYGK